MPRSIARLFTASSKDAGRRILSCAVFFSNSNRDGCSPDRSYSLRSAVSTKCSASASVRKVGIFFFITRDLPRVHVTGTNWTDQALAVSRPDREDQKDRASGGGLADRAQALLAVRMRGVGN